MYIISFTEEALHDLKKLGRRVSERIIDKLKFYAGQGDILKFAKPLHGFTEKRYRFRVGNYRIVFRIMPDGVVILLLILAIGHRKDVYLD